MKRIVCDLQVACRICLIYYKERDANNWMQRWIIGAKERDGYRCYSLSFRVPKLKCKVEKWVYVITNKKR